MAPPPCRLPVARSTGRLAPAGRQSPAAEEGPLTAASPAPRRRPPPPAENHDDRPNLSLIWPCDQPSPTARRCLGNRSASSIHQQAPCADDDLTGREKHENARGSDSR